MAVRVTCGRDCCRDNTLPRHFFPRTEINNNNNNNRETNGKKSYDVMDMAVIYALLGARDCCRESILCRARHFLAAGPNLPRQYLPRPNLPRAFLPRAMLTGSGVLYVVLEENPVQSTGARYPRMDASYARVIL